MTAHIPDDSKKRVRLAPRRGPLHLAALTVTALIMLVLPVAYVMLVQGIGVYLGWSGFMVAKALLAAESFPLREICQLVCLLIGGAGWIGMVRPLLPAERRHLAAMQVTKNTQPSLFALIQTLCRNLRVKMPAEVWFDSKGSIRVSLHHGLRGVMGGDLVMMIGMPLGAVLGAREIAAALAQELGPCAGGLGLRLTHIVREMNAWFFRALYHRDPWEDALALQPDEDESRIIRFAKRAGSAFIWVSQRPFWLMMCAARWTSFLPMHMIETRAVVCAERLIGVDESALLQHKQRILEKAIKQARTDIDEGLTHRRLPENFTLLVARIFSRLNDATPPPAPKKTRDAAKNPPAAGLIDQLPANAEGAALIRQFVDLARQVSYFYYQHELGIAIHQHRMVAHDETLYQKRHQHEALGVIRRYFGGLMHPERSLCGLALTGVSTDTGDLAQEVIKGRQWEKQYERQIRLALREWNLAWQRRRDLECAWVLSLAGYAVCRLDYGTVQSNPETYRSEAKAQKMIMDHLDDPLRMCETHLEKRFAAALGMLWHAQAEILPDRLVEMRKQMPLWAHVYESLANVLPEFRELLTSFYSFQTLGGRVAGMSDSGAFASAMQSIVPGMMARARHLSKALDGACYPFAEDGIAIPLSDYLCASLGGSGEADPRTALGMHAMAKQMAHDAAVTLTPFVDRFLELYHLSFAWLASTAEASENFFVGPAYADEIIMSEVESLAGIIKSESEIAEPELAVAG